MREYWAQIDGAEDGYMVSNLGRVKGIRKPLLGQHDNGIGYLQCKIKMKDGKSRWLKVHRLVAAAFIPNPFGLSDVNHKDGNKANNRADNLEWTSHAENVRHAIKTGLHFKRRLTPGQIKEIRSSRGRQAELAEKYGVSQTTISQIRRGVLYGWVD